MMLELPFCPSVIARTIFIVFFTTAPTAAGDTNQMARVRGSPHFTPFLR
jgi:hypothetical protein